MKTETEVQEFYNQELQRVRDRATRTLQYMATRKHWPALPAHLVLDAVRHGNQIVQNYKPCSPYNPRFSPEGWRALHCRWIENTDKAGLRFVDHADLICRSIQHTGWFTDPHGDFETYRGAVWQLPARNGRAQYVFGYSDPNNDGAALIEFDIVEGTRGYYQGGWCDVDDMLIAAARDADSFAERMAESEKDYQVKDQAEQRADELREEAKQARSDLCESIREERDKIAALLAEADELIENPWSIVHGY